MLSSTSIEVRWSPPPLEDQNGDITAYKILYRRMSLVSNSNPETMVQVDADVRSYVLEGLRKYSLYDIRVVACTAIGDGPPSDSLSIRTAEDGMYVFP